MRKTRIVSLALLTLACVLPAFGQGDYPPIIEEVRLFIDGVPFNPATDVAQEGDLILVEVDVYDLDFSEWDPDWGWEDAELFYEVRAVWYPYAYPTYVTPEPPPMFGTTARFEPALYRLFPPSVVCTFSFALWVPEWVGVNQARMRGWIDWDVQWEVRISVSNTQDPGEDDPVDRYWFWLYAVENPALQAPNPPPFADAGADQTVPMGLEIILDGSRTFDNYNAGFDVADEDVFAKDELTFTWEWLSGPVRVDPVEYPAGDPHTPIAIVTLNIPNDPDDPSDAYVYRLTVDDNVNALPSTDSVRIRVLDELPPKNPPQAVIEGPASARPVGATITLVSRSTDPDRPDDPNGILLDYRWQQTNELGGPLAPEELQDTFVPLSGQTEKTSTWQALTPGTFYFRLLVDDGDFISNTTFSVEVIETETGGAAATAEGSSTGSGSSADEGVTEQQDVPAPALCGAGLLPVAAVPLALCVLRRRVR